MGKHSNCKECRSAYRKNLRYNKPIAGKMKCEQCSQIKLVSEFYADRSKSTGLQSYCIQCLLRQVEICSHIGQNTQ